MYTRIFHDWRKTFSQFEVNSNRDFCWYRVAAADTILYILLLIFDIRYTYMYNSVGTNYVRMRHMATNTCACMVHVHTYQYDTQDTHVWARIKWKCLGFVVAQRCESLHFASQIAEVKRSQANFEHDFLPHQFSFCAFETINSASLVWYFGQLVVVCGCACMRVRSAQIIINIILNAAKTTIIFFF